MSDPAIEAAQRTLQKWITGDGWNASRGLVAIDAAREALAPLRELHHKVPLYMEADEKCFEEEHDVFETLTGVYVCTCRPSEESICAECTEVCGGSDLDLAAWPCETARLIYPSEEL